MKPDGLPPLDPDHEVKRATFSTIGLVMLGVGVPCGLLGFGLFLSNFLSFTLSPTRGVFGIVLIACGGFLSIFGMKLLAAGNLGRIMRYQAGEVFPVSRDVTHHAMPLAHQVSQTVAQGLREGWTGEGRVRHACGAWNEPTSPFCKGCGEPLGSEVGGRTCPACRARNDLDANFCSRCGSRLSG